MPFEQLLFDFAEPLQRERPRPRGVRARPPRGGLRALEHVRIDGKKVMPSPPRGIDHERPAQRRYDAIVGEFLATHGLRVRCWRRSLSGLATLRIFRDGRQERTIESPYPTSPLRLAIFLHEVGHHVIGLGTFRPRCLEEFHAWRYAIDRMNELGVPTEGTVQRRFERSMRYAVAKSTRRGIRRVPAELAPFA
ncbi:MAG: hypothetical protein RIS45_85 [Planctomycetota bacterium]|jgi:hypothetical protein